MVDGASRDDIRGLAEGFFDFRREIDKAQADGRIDLDQNVYIAALTGFVTRGGTEQSEARQRIATLQAGLDVPQDLQSGQTTLKGRLARGGSEFKFGRRAERRSNVRRV